ncbi:MULTISPECIES: type-F conjugative transfer system pilin assembly protein TrbC [Sphingomonadaceae]|uniref:type-F conjugative transfer system pilin assembly protein TrbC n=1 Tax=Sphingomonadales TaxID=204457 RepID=UPI0002C078C7|nr:MULTISPECIES: type-F conjugative transfer system pilin assembly protein TrbC [Sphingomonadaceae]AGH51817.1 type-F conjugative transfer system pilin assembly protein TrbC [Sphingomonas sp. MM-1]
MRLLTLGAVGLVAAAGMTALLAQTVDGIDVQAIKQRSTDLQADAQAFVDQIKDRGDAFREEAAAVRDGGMENMQRVASTDLPKGPAGSIDFDEIVQGAVTNAAAGGGEAPQLIAFASLSMPPKALRRLIQDTARAGGVVVFRGFPNNSMKEFSERLGKIVERQDDFANIGIDPRLFRAFDVQAVPTYIAVSSDFDLCAGFSCRTQVPPYDRMIGNVTVEYALTSFADGNGPGARVAAVGLANLRKALP